jgi:multidrug resistance efflux pump
VKAGELLVEFDTEAIDRKLDDSKRAVDSATLTLGQTEVELKSLKESLPLKLDVTKRAARNAADDLAYFNDTSRKIKEQRAEETLKRYQHALEGEREELRQLEKMYKADDLTEETEEIILKRQHDSVSAAEFALKAEELDHKRTLETEIPREAEELISAAKSTALALAKAETELPRQISLKEIEFTAARIAFERQKDDFAKLSADRKLIEPIKAPVDGWFYYGAIEDGRWTTGEAIKTLVPSGQVAAKKTFATFIPASSPLTLTAYTDESTAVSLPADCSGFAIAPGREDLVIPAKVAKIAPTPGTDGRFRIDLTATWPANAAPVPGANAQVRLISYENPTALAVPATALRATKDGWSVTVKLADGKTGPQAVKRGRVSGELVEILSGLEAGQVIVTP